jgi:hypothetical protein
MWSSSWHSSSNRAAIQEAVACLDALRVGGAPDHELVLGCVGRFHRLVHQAIVARSRPRTRTTMHEIVELPSPMR